MNQCNLLKEITATYQKFGWTLRRALLTEKTRREFAHSACLIPEMNLQIESSEIDALWFARVAGNRETWELRLLSASPFALVEIFERDASAAERAKTLVATAEKMRIKASQFKV